MKEINGIFIDNASHGYLKVSMNDFKAVIDDPSVISGYSGIEDGHVFLEEDCDAGVFINAVSDKGFRFSHTNKYDETYRCPKNYCASIVEYGY